MSNTEHFVRPAAQHQPKELKRIVNRAHTLVNSCIEPNSTVQLVANTIIDDFADVSTDHPRMSFKERIVLAKQLSGRKPGQAESWEHTCGAAMATSVLEMSAKVEMKTMSFGKALHQMNRTIRQRERVHAQRTSDAETGREFKPSIPVDAGSWSGRSKSAKPPYRRPNKAQRGRKAA